MTETPGKAEKGAFARQVDRVGWALFFIWIGIAVLADIGWGWSLLGVSAIILGAQAILALKGAETDGFWIACGLVFLAGGLWELFSLDWPLVPILLILLGVAMLWSAISGRRLR